ncbi:MAG: hypothetical protein J6K69_05025 [Candidatus Methanomethylophilaceae archaeon]|nr:hypothetical protein [Candidatus Methanomethylophilaceae archaeon]
MAAAARVAGIMSLFGLLFVIVGVFIIYKNIQLLRGKDVPLRKILSDSGAEKFNADLGYKGEATTTDAIYCPFCGAPVKDAEHVYCKTCGRKIV